LGVWCISAVFYFGVLFIGVFGACLSRRWVVFCGLLSRRFGVVIAVVVVGKETTVGTRPIHIEG
jgi:hypothetical protein